MRTLIHDGDASGLALFLCGMAALVGLVSRMAGIWP